MKSKFLSKILSTIVAIAVISGLFYWVTLGNPFVQLTGSPVVVSNGFFDAQHPTRVAYNETLERRLVNVGRAPFAIAARRFDCRSFLSSIRDLDFVHVSWLFNTFGTKYSCLNKLLDDPRLITLQTNLINEPGHRNRRLEKHEFLATVSTPKQFDRLLKSNNRQLRAKFDRYVRPLQNLLVSRLQPQTECLINPGLESNVSARAGAVLVAWTKEAFPFCRVIWNPIAKAGNTQRTGADLVEQHGWFPNFRTTSCTFNNDGSDISFPGRKSAQQIQYENDSSTSKTKSWLNAGNALQSAVEEFANQCEVIYLWTVEDNCFAHNQPKRAWAPPLTRPCTNGPVNKLVAREVRIAHKRGVRAEKTPVYSEAEERSFAGCSEIRRPVDGDKRGFLLKQSEFSNRGGVIITPTDLNRAKSISVVHRGRVVDSYRRSGAYTKDRQNRDLWRSNKTVQKYPLKVAIKIKKGNRTICYRVNNPRIRND